MAFLLALFFCHFLADYTWLSRPDMLAAKRFGKPFAPILMHGMMHGALMLLVMWGFGIDKILAIQLYLFQIWSHALIDTLKGRCNGWFPRLQNPAAVPHWIVFGFDQYLHVVVILLMARFAHFI